MYCDVTECVSRVNELIDDIKAMHDKYSLIFSWICESKNIEMLNFKKITVAKTIQPNNAPIDKLRSIIIEYISFLSENTTKDFRCSAESLVDKTHTKNGPWELVYEKGQNNIITDELINSFHHIVQ